MKMGFLQTSIQSLGEIQDKFMKAWVKGVLWGLPIVVALVVVAGVLQWDQASDPRLQIKGTSPHGMLSLQLSESAQTTRAIVRAWGSPLTVVATGCLSIDNSCVIQVYVGYLLAALVYVAWRLRHQRSSSWMLRLMTVLCGVYVLVAAFVDWHFENPGLLLLLQPDGSAITEETVAEVRFAAQVKFALLSVVVSCLVASFFAIIRREVCGDSRGVPSSARTFYDLYEAEQGVLKRPTDDQVVVSGDEPWVREQPNDMVGLALSGGGVRSETFNLGLLQGLERLKLLPMLTYLSTVSGGGYVGSWWSAWRTRRFTNKPDSKKLADLPMFPPKRADQPEADEVRHLREFSNFLSPRWGLFETEMWTAFIAVLFGLGPTLLVGIVVMAIAQMSWLILTAHLGLPFWWVLPTLVAVPLSVIFLLGEVAWKDARKSDQNETSKYAYSFFALGAVAFSIWVAINWDQQVGSKSWMQPQGVGQLSPEGTWNRWMQHLGIESISSRSALPAPSTPSPPRELTIVVNPTDAIGNEAAATSGTTTIDATLTPSSPNAVWHFSGRLFDAPAIWLIVGMAVSVLRILVGSMLPREYAASLSPSIDRVLLRLMTLGVVLVAAGLLWEVGVAITRGGHLGKASIGAAGSGGLFAVLRNWLSQLQSNQQKPSQLEALKPYLPQLLAYVTVGLMYALVVAAGITCLKDSAALWMAAWFGFCLFMALALHMDPSEFGLHKLYRDRITRAFLGASNPNAYDADTGTFSLPNSYTDVRVHDDLPLTHLAQAAAPLHLVCCAANNLSGDQLSTLSRGARSAVLSCCGLSIGDRWAERPDTSLADAVTASAAAFNSQMGALSIKLGPAVGFLMSVLNLRLGIWVSSPNTGTAEPRWFPGLMFLAEMFGCSDCSDASKSHVHLSDGGHFENLALYELIRRHCRYIIVSDCGADPATTFEDFGNAVRRIREDFGVDIDIDLDPLRAGSDGKSKQHVAVGTIRFDPHGDDFDVGVLIYFKPALTGDEPCDISPYRSLNPAFPHEATGDQFYDEAQWESYRRLGVHSVMEALGFLERDGVGNAGRTAGALSNYAVFGGARNKWYPTPIDFDRTLIDLNGRFVALEQRLAEKAPVWFLKELYPELERIATTRRSVEPAATPAVAAARATADARAAAGPTAAAVDRFAEERDSVHLLVQMIQLLEDVWLAADLVRNVNHPQMLGWVNAFRRWTRAATFRIWWPYLCPLYTPGVRKFAEEKLGLGQAADLFDIEIESHTQREHDDVQEVLRRADTKDRWWDAAPNSLFAVFSIVAKGVGTRSDSPIRIPITALRYVANSDKEIQWDDKDFLTARGMWGTGLGSKALNEWLGPRGAMTGKTCVVLLDLDGNSSSGFNKHDVGHRRERNDLLNFYKRQGFIQRGKDQAKATLVRDP